MKWRLAPKQFAIVAFAMLFAAGCERELALSIPNDATIRVEKLGGSEAEFTVPRRSEIFHELDAWVASNQSGWMRYSGTPPSQGILVHAGDLRIQFVGSEVVVRTQQGVFSKSVSPGEYAFLSPWHGT